jgi:hypothetical protein
MRVELRAFYGVVGLILVIPQVAGLVGAFGGLEGMARLFGVDDPIAIAPVLRNNFRAVCCAFFSWVPLVVWSLMALAERAGAFRIIVGCAFLAGFARLTGWLVEGYPGVVPLGIMTIELGVMPILLLWHARLVRLARERDVEPGAAPAAAAVSAFGVQRLPSRRRR